jgi:hypothetical protein
MRLSIFAVLLLGALLPLSAQAGKYMDIHINGAPPPPGLYETLPTKDDWCTGFLRRVHYSWIQQQAYRESPQHMVWSNDYTREEKWEDANGRAPAGSAGWALARFEVMIIWDKKLTLRDTEQAMLKKCQSIPPKAKQFPGTDYGLKE